MSLLVYKSAKSTTVTNSMLFAKAFSISHKEALRKCANLNCDTEFNRANYAPIAYLDKRNRKQRAVMMTREGFIYLALSLTGSKAAAFRQKYIHQFEAMDNQLRNTTVLATPLTDFTKPAIQVQQVKAAASYLFGFGVGVGEVMRHHRAVMRLLTGVQPSTYIRNAVARGLKVKSLSGRQVLRRLEPQLAATAAFLDEQVQKGHTLEQMAAAGITSALPVAFAAMMKAGITPAELSNP